MESVNFVEAIGKNEKLCFDCKTSKTPLWRSGPAGPKSLCNACGIRFRKKKSVSGSDKKKEKRELSPSPSNSPTTSLLRTHARNRPIPRDDNTQISQKKLRVKVVTMGKEMMVMQRHRSPVKKVKRMENEMKKFGEVEEAAYSLMCLSCG